MDLETALSISATGMQVQTERLRVIAENVANAESSGSTPGADPYRRRTVQFESVLDPALAGEVVRVRRIGRDPSAFPQKFDPASPAADAAGYVRMPNVNPLVEMMDMRNAERSYGANLSVMQASRAMLTRVIDLLK